MSNDGPMSNDGAPASAVTDRRRPRADDALVEVRGVDFRFGSHPVLERVDLSVRADEIVTVVGPNGAGKTTLVRIVLGLLRPEGGRVVVHPGLSIGYVPQRLHVDPVLPLTVHRFVSLGSRAPQEDCRRVLDEVGVARLFHEAFQDLSGGELQRVVLARALLRQPDLLVLDEPVQGVDVAGQIELFDVISRIRAARGCGVLMVSHDLHLVMAATDRVVCLNRHVCCAGRPDAVQRHPEFIALFGTRAAQALALYAHDHDHAHDAGGNVVPLENRGEGAAADSTAKGHG